MKGMPYDILFQLHKNYIIDFTGFSVATAIHNNVQQYYKVFKDADNRADLTFFIQKLLEILVSQQEKIIEILKKSSQRYPMTKTRLAIKELEELGAIKIVSKRLKQHIIQILIEQK